MTRTSIEWAEEIARMIAEQAATAAATERLTGELGAAYLDAPETATGLQQELASAQAQQVGLAAAIGQAEQRQAAAAADEERLRLSLQVRAYLAVTSRRLVRRAEVRALEAQLEALRASQAEAAAADREIIDRVGRVATQLGLPTVEALSSGSADDLRTRAATLAEQAERALVRDGAVTFDGGPIDADRIPTIVKADRPRPPVPIDQRVQRAAEQRRTDRRAVVLRGEIQNLTITNSPAEVELLARKQAELQALEQSQRELGAA